MELYERRFKHNSKYVLAVVQKAQSVKSWTSLGTQNVFKTLSWHSSPSIKERPTWYDVQSIPHHLLLAAVLTDWESVVRLPPPSAQMFKQLQIPAVD